MDGYLYASNGVALLEGDQESKNLARQPSQWVAEVGFVGQRCSIHPLSRLTADQLETYPSTLDCNHLASRSVSAVCLVLGDSPVRV